MPRLLALSSLLCAALLAACVPLGWRFGPGFSMEARRDLFAEPPVVERRGSDYVLAWRQGSSPFFFQPTCEAMDGRLVFALVATASSGSLAGSHREMKITGAEKIAALERGGAFWWEPAPEPWGRLVRLSVIEAGQR